MIQNMQILRFFWLLKCLILVQKQKVHSESFFDFENELLGPYDFYTADVIHVKANSVLNFGAAYN